MPKKHSSKSSKKSRSFAPLRSYNFFIALAVLFGMFAGVMLVKLLYQGERITITPKQSQVELGSYRYEFKDGKAIKRTDKLTTSLQTFLDKKASADCVGLEPSRYDVVAANSDRTQVLLGYGCNGNSEARMFAVYRNNAWKLLSPTNQFDMLTKAPRCDHVNQNSIDNSLAPVCYNDENNTVTYTVR